MEDMADLLGIRNSEDEAKDARKPLEALASQALDLVMKPTRTDRDIEAAELTYSEIINALTDAFRADDPDMRRKAVSDLLVSGVSGREFIHSHAGDTARMLGDLWAENKISFAETTIGVARLQETVRSLAARGPLEKSTRADAEILLLAPEGENHLLGLFIACEAFEEAGCYVHLAIGQDVNEIANLVQRHHFAMIGISISSNRTVKEARAIVKKLRSGRSRTAPIVLGGGLVADAAKHAELIAETEVDHVTCNPMEALDHCGIEIEAPDDRCQAMTQDGHRVGVR